MKELLNKLIEKGRVPFSDKRITNVSWKMQYVGTYNWIFWSNHNVVQFWKSTRELVSKESGLWQFVCENGMIDIDDIYTRDFIDEGRDYIAETYSSNTDYEYWVLRSALYDEDKLEQFLLQNIKVEG